MTAWRAAGLNYVRYSQIVAQVTRQCLQGGAKTAAEKRLPATIRITKWEAGKPIIRK